MNLIQYIKDNVRGNVRTVIDGGAYVGAYTAEIREAFPQATVHCFEPQGESCKYLMERFHGDPYVVVNRKALGHQDARHQMLVTTSAAYNSSLLTPMKDTERYMDQVLMEVGKPQFVEMTKLDSYCTRKGIRRIDILKLDLQGFDLYALHGSLRMLAWTKFVQCELLYVPLYVGQPFAEEIIRLLAACGFELVGYGDGKIGPEGQPWWRDGLFEKL